MNAHTEIDTSFVPHVEQEVLGALMMGADNAKQVFSFLEPSHFIDGPHQIIYEAIRSGFERYNSANPVVVAKLVPEGFADGFALKNDGIRLSSYLSSLCAETVYGPSRLVKSARHVVEQWARLEMGKVAGQMHAASEDPSADVREIGRGVARDLDDILSHVRGVASRKTRVSLADAASNAIVAAREAMSSKGITGVTYGLADVNRATGGMHKKDLTLLAARPSMGKSAVALSCAIKAARKGHGIGYISLEMDSDKLAARAISDIAFDWNVHVAYADLIRGVIEPRDLESVEAASKEFQHLPLWIEDQSGMTFTDIRVKIELLIEEATRAGSSIDAVFIDHLGLIKPSSRYSGNRTNEIGEISAGLKSLAREMDIAIIALNQLSRAVESRDNKRPMLSDLRDSGALEQDADTIIFLYREAYYLSREKGGGHEKELERSEKLQNCRNILEFNIAKQRNGALSNIDLFFSLEHSAIRNGAQR